MGKNSKVLLISIILLASLLSLPTPGQCPQGLGWQAGFQYMLRRGIEKNIAFEIAQATFAYSPTDPDLIIAVVEAESGFNPKAVGKNGERGLMQVSNIALRDVVNFNPDIEYAPEKLFDIEYNILVGCRYLKISYQRAKKYLPDGYNDFALWVSAIMAYKDGFRWRPHTFFYARKVIQIHKKINELGE